MPGGLPVTKMPAYLTETRWGRCALLKQNASPVGLIAPWRWSDQVNIALAPDISCFRAGTEYAHGGFSLQECLTPILTATLAGGGGDVQIDHIVWRGLRCKFAATGRPSDLTADIRTRAADPAASVLAKTKKIGKNGEASLLVKDDRLEGTAAFIVLVDERGRVAAKTSTTIGGE